MRQRVATLACAGLLVGVSAAAQEPSDSIKWVGTDRIEIKSTVIASNGCYSAGTVAEGHPDGATPIQTAVLVTFPIEHSGGLICTQALKPLEFSITTAAPTGVHAVVIYTTDKLTKSVSARALALPSR